MRTTCAPSRPKKSPGINACLVCRTKNGILKTWYIASRWTWSDITIHLSHDAGYEDIPAGTQNIKSLTKTAFRNPVQ